MGEGNKMERFTSTLGLAIVLHKSNAAEIFFPYFLTWMLPAACLIKLT